jgi:hypothetical protein
MISLRDGLVFFLGLNNGFPIRPMDARLQNESVDGSDEHDASRENLSAAAVLPAHPCGYAEGR